MVDLSNLLMNANALVMPLVCFTFTRGFRDLFFAVRYVPNPSGLCTQGCNEAVEKEEEDDLSGHLKIDASNREVDQKKFLLP